MIRFLLSLFIWIGCFSTYAQDFREVSEEYGIMHVTFDPNQMSGGVSVIDFNNDGYEDLYFTGGKYVDHLFKNTGQGGFQDVTEEMGLIPMESYYTVGVIAGDLDNDGYTDLFITTQQGQPNVGLRNVEGKRFDIIGSESGLYGNKWSTTCTMGDVDQDGDLDLYISNFVSYSGDPFFRYIDNEEPNHFIENLGDWTFARGDLNFVGNTDGCTLVSCFTDMDDDMDPDLHIVNDFGTIYTPNELFINDAASGQMVEMAGQLGVDVRMDGMGIAIGDVDENGYYDYYLSNIGVCPFFLNDEGLVFTDGNESYDVNDGFGFSWGTFFSDINNDSHLDLYVAKGSISESHDPQHNKLYLFNSRRNNFIDVSISSGIDDPNKGRGAVYADLNNDGLLDIIVNNVRIKEDNNGHAQVYLNQGKSNGGFIKIKLEGVQSNRSAIGAQVELYADGRMLKREVTGGSSYLSNHSYVVHFGTGSLTIDSLVIRWPSGNRQLFNQIENNAFYYVRENENMQLYEYGTTTSTIEHIVYDFNVYPNPATNQLNITRIGETLDPVSITLQTLDGKPVNYTNLLTAVPNRPHELQIDISSLSAGLYFLCIREKEKTYCKKILVVD